MVWVGCGAEAGQWDFVSLFTKVTVVPFFTVRLDGSNPVAVILISTLAGVGTSTSTLTFAAAFVSLLAGDSAGGWVSLLVWVGGLLLQAAATNTRPKTTASTFFIVVFLLSLPQ